MCIRDRPGGELVRVREAIGDLLLVSTGGDEQVLLARASGLVEVEIAPGDSLIADRRALLALERVVRSDVEELRLDEVPDVTYADIGGLGAQIELITDAIELPFLHRDLFAEFGLAAPKGVLLYGCLLYTSRCV